MARQLFTVGYEGVRIDAFIANLLSHGVTCVLDVRALPLSRKAGFSKNRLAQRLEDSKIDYVHLGELGTPKAIRDDLKATNGPKGERSYCPLYPPRSVRYSEM